MVGNPFSPHYARARSKGPTDPRLFSTFNVALYRRGGDRWALTERGRVDRSEDALCVGGSSIRVTRDGYRLEIDERAAVGLARVRGSIDVQIEHTNAAPHALDEEGRHTWWPIAPRCHAEVRMRDPNVTFRGHAYFDSNTGSEPLERAFRTWNWSRATAGDRTIVSYEAVRRDGTTKAVDLAFDRGRATHVVGARDRQLSRTRWGVDRKVRGPGLGEVLVVRSLEDGPFYSRTQLVAELGGSRHAAVHESLDLDRFTAGWVQFLVPFRMRRSAL